jgi:Arc/MetJ family transcription regulator
MRTNIVIDDARMQQAIGAHSKREAVEMGLRALVQLGLQAEFRAFRGKLRWEGSLDNQRLDGPTIPGFGQPM